MEKEVDGQRSFLEKRYLPEDERRLLIGLGILGLMNLIHTFMVTFISSY